MAKPDIDVVAAKAKAMNFMFRVMGSGRYQLLLKSRDGALTGKGYMGPLGECLAYLMGWQEHELTTQG